jgi:hypothetical protein
VAVDMPAGPTGHRCSLAATHSLQPARASGGSSRQRSAGLPASKPQHALSSHQRNGVAAPAAAAAPPCSQSWNALCFSEPATASLSHRLAAPTHLHADAALGALGLNLGRRRWRRVAQPLQQQLLHWRQLRRWLDSGALGAA